MCVLCTAQAQQNLSTSVSSSACPCRGFQLDLSPLGVSCSSYHEEMPLWNLTATRATESSQRCALSHVAGCPCKAREETGGDTADASCTVHHRTTSSFQIHVSAMCGPALDRAHTTIRDSCDNSQSVLCQCTVSSCGIKLAWGKVPPSRHPSSAKSH
jgi:hypothetical protein